ncbi:hypothetical protein DIPPA_20070 [Diplonema papillatum]|nr:hypothetical protein DIPPA_20070 [Diplonema papillatum]|eukprot:gene2220-3422_t
MSGTKCIKRLKVSGERVEALCDRDTGKVVAGSFLFSNLSKHEKLSDKRAKQLFGSIDAGFAAVEAGGEVVEDHVERLQKKKHLAELRAQVEDLARKELKHRYTGEHFNDAEYHDLVAATNAQSNWKVDTAKSAEEQYLSYAYYLCKHPESASIRDSVCFTLEFPPDAEGAPAEAEKLRTLLRGLPAGSLAVLSQGSGRWRLLAARPEAREVLQSVVSPPVGVAAGRATDDEVAAFSTGALFSPPADGRQAAAQQAAEPPPAGAGGDGCHKSRRSHEAKTRGKSRSKAAGNAASIEEYEQGLNGMPIKRLVELCRVDGVGTVGRKQDLVERLMLCYEMKCSQGRSTDSD